MNEEVILVNKEALREVLQALAQFGNPSDGSAYSILTRDLEVSLKEIKNGK